VNVIRLLLADDNAFVRSSLIDLLSSLEDIEVVAECTDGDEVVEAAQRTHPDVVILDLAMARVGGLEAARRLLDVQPDARIVILTATLSAADVAEARSVGVVGYLLKDSDPEELPHHVRAVAGGGTAWRAGPGQSPELPYLTERRLTDTGSGDLLAKPHNHPGLWS
jgi:DNA-binding NarL/FixJ family response regulator